jgi:tRNA(Ile)-lysidine synthase
MVDKVLSTIERYDMLKRGTTVVAALSGGADSMALLFILSKLEVEYGFNLIAAHINHGLRGEEADRDESFVREYCSKNGIVLEVGRVDLRQEASSTGEGEEECGRRIRYAFLNSIGESCIIATAHTLSDSIETILFNIIRGTALTGLCGIPPVRDNIIRPLIACSRMDVEHFCSQNEIPYIIDSTNMSDRYTRNHIRLNIIPQIKKINPRYTDAFLRCSESLSQDDDLLNQLSQEIEDQAKIEEGFKTSVLLSAHPALRKRALSNIFKSHSGAFPTNKQIEAADMLLHKDGTMQIQAGVVVSVSHGILMFPASKQSRDSWCYPLNNELLPSWKSMELKIVNKTDLENIQKVHNNILDNCFDYDKILGNSVVRSRCEGDCIRLSKRCCTKTLKKLFNEMAIPMEDRNDIAVIADDLGVVWVEGVGVAQRCEPSCNTKKYAIILFRGISNA